MRHSFWGSLVCFQIIVCSSCIAQSLQPGLSGMSPSKWMTLKNTQAPGKVYRTTTSQSQTFTQEDIYFRVWIPVIRKSSFSLIAGPHYRTEQLELKDNSTENPLHHLSNWHLRSLGLDLRSLVKLDSTSWLMIGGHINQSGNLNEKPYQNVPLNYTFSTVFIRKKSIRKEIGFGFILNKSYNLTPLPIFIFNYNYAKNAGIEIGLPHKIAWRYNATRSDIFYIKSEAVTRMYYIKECISEPGIFRRVDIDTGIAYNKQITKFFGIELFTGYRQNISNQVPEGVVPVKTSGFAASLELYVRPPVLNRER